MKDKPFITHVGCRPDAVIPITPKVEWPAFPEPQKPSNNSPFRTVLWFHAEVNNGVRILVEGRDKASVETYAKLVSQISEYP